MPCEIGWINHCRMCHVRRGCAGVRWSLVPARVHVSCVCAMSIVLEPELTNANPTNALPRTYIVSDQK